MAQQAEHMANLCLASSSLCPFQRALKVKVTLTAAVFVLVLPLGFVVDVAVLVFLLLLLLLLCRDPPHRRTRNEQVHRL